MKNSPAIKRVAVCVALAALGLIGAGWFVTARVAGQETRPQTLRGVAALERLKQDGQYESLQAAMLEARFGVNLADDTPLGRAAWHAPNRSAGYDAYVTEEGVSVAVNDKTIVSLSLRSIGYGEALQAIAPGEVYADKQTINITRNGGVREWYVNGPDGLEHGFTLSEPPGFLQKGSPLRLALEVSEGWRAVASEDGKLVNLRGANDQMVEYGKLVARDKLGRNVPARLTVAEEQVVIEVEDSEAAYPLTIDPLFTLQQKLTAVDGMANDFLGHAVALDGDTALVGAPYDDVSHTEQGSAYVFVRAGGTWMKQATLTAQDGASFDYFGWAVALDGDYALVGAVYGPGSVNPDQGAVYVFVRGGNGTWSQQTRLNAEDGQALSQFGAAVAIDGQTALIGAYQSRISASSGKTGAAYVFTRSGAAWTQQARLSAEDGAADDLFGFSVALDGDTALIGAPADDVGAKADQGSAYLFTRSGAIWTPLQKLTTTDSAAGDQFGASVALSGEKALIGAHLYGSDDSGKVFTFQRRADGWTQTDGTISPNPAAGAHFGVSVALSGDTAVIGASRGPFAPGADHRSAYVFVYTGEWSPARRLGPELGSANDGFGYAVALDGDTVLVGAYRGDAGANDQGAAYAFVLRGSQSVEQQKLTANDGGADEYFGIAVALDGDKLAVGAGADTIGGNAEQGSVYVYTRTGVVWTLQQKLTADDGEAYDFFGGAIALSGDTLVVGAKGDDINGKADQGSAYIFTRNGTVWTQRQKLKAVEIDASAGDKFATSVALSGQTVAVGAPGADNGRGSAYVFTLNGAVWKEQAKLNANDGATGDEFGYAVALSGDTLAVGAFRDTVDENAEQGSVYVFTRSGAAQPVWAQRAKLIADDGGPGDNFGGAVALSDDTLAVGAFRADVGANVDQGSVYVFTRAGATWTQRQKLIAGDGASDDFFGVAVAISGGVLVIGASRDTIGASAGQGSAYVFALVGDWQLQQKLTARDGSARDGFGGAVALSGDTLVIGVDGDNIAANANQGSAYVFVNPPCPALTITPASLPGAALGASYSQQLTAGGGAGDYQFTVSAGALPPGLTLNHQGLLQGALTAAGTYRFTITATFPLSGCIGSRDYAITVAPCPALTLNPIGLPAVVQGAAYNQTLTLTGGVAPYNFTVTAGALPPGLSLSAGGVLSGAPSQPGSYSFTVRGVDANGCAATRAYTLAVGCKSLTVSPATLPSARQGVAYNQNLTAVGGVAPYRFTVVNGALPPGVSLSLDGVLSGAPTQAGSFVFAVSTQDSGVCVGVQGFTLTVAGAVTHASAASYSAATLAPDSIVAAFGADLATEARVAEGLPLPTELAGTTVKVRDSQGAVKLAPLFFVAPAQVNYLMPPGLASGAATVTITNGNGVAITGSTEISAVAPGLFSANASGAGVAAAVVLRIRADGQQAYEPVARYDAQTQKFVPLPIDLSNSAEQVYLILFGTGIRHHGSVKDVMVELGGTQLPVTYAGAAPGLAGVDQVNVSLPAGLSGRGEQTVTLLANGKASNGVKLHFQ